MKHLHTPAEIRANARRITRRSDLPPRRGYARFVWGDDGSALVRFRDRQVLEALMAGPVFAASPVRVGDAVFHLRGEGLPIATEIFEERDGDERLSFGVYYLSELVYRADELEGV